MGLTAAHLAANTGPMLASVRCEFKKPLFYPGEVTILTRIGFIENSSFGFHHLLLNAEGEHCAEVQDSMVMYDFDAEQKTPFPQQFGDAIAQPAKKPF